MAAVDARLSNAAFEDVKRFKIVKGEKFSLSLRRTIDDYQGPIDWAHTGDPALKIVANPNAEVYDAEFTAEEVGISRVFIIQKRDDEEFAIIKQLKIEVVAVIADLAVNLNLTGEIIER
jgi:hypothetical protein